MSRSAKSRSFWNLSPPVFRFGTEETKPDAATASNTVVKWSKLTQNAKRKQNESEILMWTNLQI